MSLGILCGSVIWDDGRVAAGAAVSVFDAGTTDLANTYDTQGTSAIPNPLTASVGGAFACSVAEGHYDLQVTFGGISKTTAATVRPFSASSGGA